jgi:hypothetical protein
MKKMLIFFAFVFHLQNCIGQVEVHDHRTERDTSSALVRPRFEEMVVFRIQLRLTTGKGSGAGTDDPVYVQLNNGDKKFYLIKGIDNFKEGSTVVYDVLSDNVKKVKDIEFLRFGIEGDDGACLKRIDLLLNGSGTAVFSKLYPTASGACMDNGSSSLSPTIEFSGSQLRTATSWGYTDLTRNIMWRPPTQISKLWMVSLVEASIGNQIQHQGSGLQWGSTDGINTIWGDAVEVARVNDHTLHFDLDLQRDVAGPNTEIDIDFDLDFHCTNGSLSFDIENLKVNTSLYGDIRNFIIEKGSLIVAGALTVATGGLAFPTFYGAVLLKLNNGFAQPKPDGTTVAAACTKAMINNNGDVILK